jgi:hypothetical protein
MPLAPETALRQAVDLIIQSDREGLPVFDAQTPSRCVGLATRSAVLAAYGESVKR